MGDDNTVTVAILAGGASRRMGRDKSFVELEGRPMIAHVIAHLEALALPVAIITNTPDAYAGFGLPCHTDVMPGSGSLGGIYTALWHSPTDYVLCVACDMPFLNPALLRHLIGLRAGYDAVVPVTDGRAHGLHAVYARHSRDAMRAQIDAGNLRITDLLGALRVREVPADELRAFDPALRSLRNLNSPADIDQARAADRD